MVQFDSAKNIIDRMIDAYKLKTMKALCEYFDVGISVLANRVVRNTIPAEYIIQCSLDTGANLLWLCSGVGETGIDDIKNTYIDLISVPRYSFINGKLNPFPKADLDRSMLPDEIGTPEVIKSGKTHYIIDKKFDVTNGKFVIDIEGSIGIYDLYRVPVNKVVISGGDLPKELELNVNDINILAKVAVVMSEV